MNRRTSLFVLLFVVSSCAFSQMVDLAGISICIDPGHGGYDSNDRRIEPDPGNVFWESESNFQKALLLKSLLEAKGAYVILTRISNTYEPTLSERWQLANTSNVNWFHSIHSNAINSTPGTNTSINYTLVLVKEDIATRQPARPQAVVMSDIIGAAIQKKLRTSPRSIYTYLDYTFYGGTNGGYNLGVLSGLAMSGELSEGSMHDFYPETRRLLNNDYRKMEAYALRDAFLQYFGVPADTLCIVAGILSNATGALVNGAKVRLLPENIVYTGDNYNNGFYMFDGVKAGAHTLSFETPNYETASVPITLEAGQTRFLDRVFGGGATATVTWFGPSARDTLYPVNQTIGMSFSAAMDTASVRQAFSITPTVSGTFTWYNYQMNTFIFKPDQPFQYLTWYAYRIAATARTAGGGYLDGNGDGTAGDDFVVKFRTMPPPVSVEQESAIPTFWLAQNYPNPFNPTTNFEFRISNFEFATLRIFDVLGREVATLVNEMRPVGVYTVRWDGRNNHGESVSSGMYLYQLKAGSATVTKRMILLK